jgi:methionyl-tRNA formyltransferase
VPERQPEEGVTYAHEDRQGRGAGGLDAARPAEVDRLIRGLSPFPGAWCDAGGERVSSCGRASSPARASRAGAGRPRHRLRGGGGGGAGGAARRGKALPAAEALRGWAPPARLG